MFVDICMYVPRYRGGGEGGRRGVEGGSLDECYVCSIARSWKWIRLRTKIGCICMCCSMEYEIHARTASSPDTFSRFDHEKLENRTDNKVEWVESDCELVSFVPDEGLIMMIASQAQAHVCYATAIVHCSI